MAVSNQQPTPAELKARLREKPLPELTEEMEKLSDDPDCDVDLLCAYLEILEEKAPVLPQDYDPAAEYTKFRKTHGELFDLAESKATAPKKSGFAQFRQLVLTFAAVFCLVIFVADANGAGVLDRLIEWGSETFTLHPISGTMELPSAGKDEFRSLQEALDYYRVEGAAIPTWIPSRYSIDSVTISKSDSVTIISGRYTSGNEELLIRGSISHDEDFTFEKDVVDDHSLYAANGISFVLSANFDEKRAVWTSNGYVYSASGNITEKELEKMLDSVQVKE